MKSAVLLSLILVAFLAGFALKAFILKQKTDDINEMKKPDRTITAKSAPEYNASTKILQKNSFVFTEIVQDEEIGDAWLWIYKKAD